MPLRAGRLRNRVELQQLTKTRNEYGDEEKTYTTIRTVWAGIEALRGRELFEAQQHGYEATTRIVIRNPGFEITNEWRVVHGGKEYDIQGVVPSVDGTGVELMCRILT